MFLSQIFKAFWKEKKMHLNIVKTLYFNFKVFPIKDAIKLPVFLYGDIQLEGIRRGCVVLNCIRTRSVVIGGGWFTEFLGNAKLYRTFIRIQGQLNCGRKVKICQGCIISINEGAVLSIGDRVRFNVNTKIHSKERIEIEDNCRIGWNCQIYDTNFHYTINKGKIYYRNASVKIRHNSWIANGVSIMKGTHLPAFSVVASNSVVNKDFSSEAEKSFFAGIPAKCIAHDIERILDDDKKIDALFNEDREPIEYNRIKGFLK